MTSFGDWFKNLTNNTPHAWQACLGQETLCCNRLIRIPTGLGKTHGVLAAWVSNRLQRKDNDWPRRLVWCLPMRVLVEQTKHEVEGILRKMDRLWTGNGLHTEKVGVHMLMGGCDADDWHLWPEEAAVLIGTQDMLLSRALNRGYAAPRARWPMEFGMLNQDCLWVMDEVQLMDVGLATSAQLQAFREQEAAKSLRPCVTWWMSATLQREWLQKSPETQPLAAQLDQGRITISPAGRKGPLWEQVTKTLQVAPAKDSKAIADLVAREHRKALSGAQGPTLVVLNTVDRACQVFDELSKLKAATDIQLLHSRFRPHERQRWQSFLNRQACAPGTDRIIVATQVVEAGVDISARVLVTELAPWPNLVQRFGRAARWGGTAAVVVADLNLTGKKAAPYDEATIAAARGALAQLTDVALVHLERFEETHPDLLPNLYPYDPKHLLLRHELDDLFDTTPDLSGADVDISRFIRSGDERDCHVFWAEVAARTEPPEDLYPARDALCSVPFLKAQDWLCGDKKRAKLRKSMRAWVWDWLDGRWRWAERRDCWPGQTILVATECGGYDELRGWSSDANGPVAAVPQVAAADATADNAQDDETSAAHPWRTIATHCREVGAEARTIADMLVPALADLLDLAGRWHDAGKAHEAFQGSISKQKDGSHPGRQALAKAPKSAWLRGKGLYPMPDGTRRPGFRHELASTLALFAVLRRHRPEHPALLGPWVDLLRKSGYEPEIASSATSAPSPLEQEILALDAAAFDLLAYLVCSHHGKVRMTWHACPADQSSANERLRIRGICDGDVLPALPLAAAGGAMHALPTSVLDLAPSAAGLDTRTGRGWTERCLDLLKANGPFRLAWLEACLRAADMRASRTTTSDPLLSREGQTP